MVKHHMKKKKNKRATNLAQAKKEEEERLKEKLKDIDRFAGSSEEEDSLEDEDEVNNNSGDEEEVENKDSSVEKENNVSENENDDELRTKTRKKKVRENNDSESSDEDEYGNIDNDSYDDDSESETENRRKASHSKIPKSSNNEKKAVGMSNAMAKILGMGIPSNNKSDKNKENSESKSAILSKTTTKLQKQQEMEKKALQSLRQKRKLRRAEHLTAMHVPVGNMVGTAPLASSSTQGKISHWEEINMERSYRRIATRGVVALFNAISKHQLAQREQQEQNAHGIKKKQDQAIQSMTKQGFLDALKQTANKKDGEVASNAGEGKTLHASNNGINNTIEDAKESNLEKEEKDSKRGGNWNALRDDFMMGAKLKDWDKEMSDDSSSESEDENGKKKVVPKDLSDDEESNNGVEMKVEKKRPIHGKRALVNGKKRGKKQKVY